MLTRLSVKNFRLLRDVTIDVEPGKPVVLIGPNSSGKSSVLQVLDLFGRAVRGGLEDGFKAFGGCGELLSVGESVLTIEVRFARGEDPFRYGFDYSYGHLHRVVNEEWLVLELLLKEAQQLLLRKNGKIRLWNMTANAHDEQRIDRQQDASQKLITALVKQPWLYPYIEDLRNELSSILLYDGFLTTPLWSRDGRESQACPFDSAVVSPVPRIDRRGLNLVNALYSLQNNHGDAWEELVHNFRAEFPFVQRLEFPPDPAGGRIALGWRDRRNPNERMRGHQMSEGMTAYLCMLAAILSPEPAAALAFDEPEAHLHPSALRRVAYLMEKASERSAVFVATHSDRFLDYLSDPAGSIHICEPSDQGVTLRKLDREALDEWRKDYSLSELRERGYLDPANESGAES